MWHIQDTKPKHAEGEEGLKLVKSSDGGEALPCRGLRGLSLRETWRCRLSNSVRLVAVRRDPPEPADS